MKHPCLQNVRKLTRSRSDSVMEAWGRQTSATTATSPQPSHPSAWGRKVSGHGCNYNPPQHYKSIQKHTSLCSIKSRENATTVTPNKREGTINSGHESKCHESREESLVHWDECWYLCLFHPHWIRHQGESVSWQDSNPEHCMTSVSCCQPV